ncbi:acyltransferase [Cesiribacter andamanensis]|uniref:Acyltransferase 3 domain-containing protein n=1 Tax=Cesiribacter andamanensis AMV16 TaxID=1279009 RepID=M7NC81_9BACT|nr:acyltransferase [Cesiribacter andamanensis]EMR04756.1 hypothetical protein ADICEAN_00027 [Cesiribacter andamanensis AMV16]
MKFLTTTPVSRESNIELLRIVLMLMIIGFHLLVHGAGVGSGETFTLTTSTDLIYILLKSFLVLAVNCFVFISGYYRIRLKIRTALSLILQTTFYSLLFLVALESTPLHQLGVVKLLESLMPIFAGTWWFITAYFALYLLSPLLNRAVDSFSKKQFLFVVLSLTFLNCVGGLLFEDSAMGFNRGFSLVSFIHIYLLGQYIRRHYSTAKLAKWSPAVYMGCSLLLFLLAYASIEHLTGKGISLVFAYNNPIVLLSAIAFFFMFKRFSLHSGLINSISPYVLGVYLFHDHPLMRQHLIEQVFTTSLQGSAMLHFGYLLLITFGIFMAGYLVDRLREYLLAPLVHLLMQKSDLIRLQHIFPPRPSSHPPAGATTSGSTTQPQEPPRTEAR